MIEGKRVERLTFQPMGTSLQRRGRMRQRTVKWRRELSDIGDPIGYWGSKLSRGGSAQSLTDRVASHDGIGDDRLGHKGGELTPAFEYASVDHNSIDVRGLGGFDHGARRIRKHAHADDVGSNHDE